MGRKQRIGNEVTDRARVQEFGFVPIFHFLVPSSLFPVLVKSILLLLQVRFIYCRLFARYLLQSLQSPNTDQGPSKGMNLFKQVSLPRLAELFVWLTAGCFSTCSKVSFQTWLNKFENRIFAQRMCSRNKMCTGHDVVFNSLCLHI